jgi:hypothetical protein
VARHLAIAQEKAMYRLHASFFIFFYWLNDMNGSPTITVHQSQRMFTEHFAHQLICAHHMQDNFICQADPSTSDLARTVWDAIGKDGGVLPGSMEHSCMECTHRKRYQSDLKREGATIRNIDLENVVAGDDLNDDNMVSILFNTLQEKKIYLTETEHC